MGRPLKRDRNREHAGIRNGPFGETRPPDCFATVGTPAIRLTGEWDGGE